MIELGYLILLSLGAIVALTLIAVLSRINDTGVGGNDEP